MKSAEQIKGAVKSIAKKMNGQKMLKFPKRLKS